MASLSHELLVYGYIRCQSKPYYVPMDISKLCLSWFIPIKTMTYKVKQELFTMFDYLLPTKPVFQGAYAIVMEVKHKQSQKKFAVKKYKHIFSDIYDTKQILNDIKLMIHLNHPNIMYLSDAIPPKAEEKNTYNEICVVMPKMDTILTKVIRSKQKLSERHIQFIIYQILNGLHYIHECGVVHNAIKPINILINASDCHLRITDFGEVTPINTIKKDREHEFVICSWYRTPEMMCGQKMVNDKVDIWGVGCIMGELYMRRPLFKGRSHIEQLQLIFNIMGIPKDLSWVKLPDAKKWILNMSQKPKQDLKEILPGSTKLAQEFLKGLLSLNPTKRMDASNAMSHEWMKEFAKLINRDYMKDICLFDFPNTEQTEISDMRQSIYDEIHGFYQIAPQKTHNQKLY